MLRSLFKLLTITYLFLSCNLLPAFSEIIKKIEITGNERIPDATIEMFSSVSINDELNSDKVNQILKSLYDTNYFKDISINFFNNTLFVNVLENPIIQNISYEGIKAQKVKDEIIKNIDGFKKALNKTYDWFKEDKNLKKYTNIKYYNI